MHERLSSDPRSGPLAWSHRLERSMTADAVMRVVQQFVQAQGRELWSSLPADSQPPPFRVADDISQYAVTLLRKRLSMERTPPEIEALCAFFAQAAQRMSAVIAARSSRLARTTAGGQG